MNTILGTPEQIMNLVDFFAEKKQLHPPAASRHEKGSFLQLLLFVQWTCEIEIAACKLLISPSLYPAMSLSVLHFLRITFTSEICPQILSDVRVRGTGRAVPKASACVSFVVDFLEFCFGSLPWCRSQPFIFAFASRICWYFVGDILPSAPAVCICATGWHATQICFFLSWMTQSSTS